MQRRSFFSALTGIIGGAATVTAAKPPRTTTEQAESWKVQCGEWTLQWSGWQRALASNTLWGWWTAYHPATEHEYFYSTTGGLVLHAFIGDQHNMSTRGRRHISTRSSEPDRQKARTAALDELRAFLAQVTLPADWSDRPSRFDFPDLQEWNRRA